MSEAETQLLNISRDRRIIDAHHFMSRLNRGELNDFKEAYPKLSEFLVEELQELPKEPKEDENLKCHCGDPKKANEAECFICSDLPF